jgi:exonuclease SbcD
MKIVHFADLHLGVENYGHINPENGLNTRFLDSLSSFDQLVDFAINKKVDLVLFCGDAYKSRDPSQTQQREFARRIKKLSTNGIPVFLLVGNHDLPNAAGRATTTEIFDTLDIEHVTVANKPDIYNVATPGGIIQVVALPWLKRTNLVSREENKNLSLAETNQKMQRVLTDIINNLATKLNLSLPSILAAHVWVQGARVGSEDSMTIGQEHVLLPATIANRAFDYVALGHIHRHQLLLENPPVIYSGSLESLDFGDEADTKGFYLVNIETCSAGRDVKYQFQPIFGRRFITIENEIETGNCTPTDTLVKVIQNRANDIVGNIVRLDISLPQELEGQIHDSEIRQAASQAYYFALSKSIRNKNQPRLGYMQVESLTPVQALKAYIKILKKGDSSAQNEQLLSYGEAIIKSCCDN